MRFTVCKIFCCCEKGLSFKNVFKKDLHCSEHCAEMLKMFISAHVKFVFPLQNKKSDEMSTLLRDTAVND